MFHSCSKYNSMSSIQWCNQIFYISNYLHKKCKKLNFYYRKSAITKVKERAIRLGTCKKCFNHVPSTTRGAISNGAIRFFISPTMSIENAKNRFFTIKIEVKVPAIRLATCYKCSNHVSSTPRSALSSGTVWFPKSLMTVPKIPQIPPKQRFSLVIPPWHRLGTCSNYYNDVPSITWRVLSNVTIRFPKSLVIVPK
jgi:hypothetical protein